MESFDYKITEPIGIHARPAELLAQFAGSFCDSVIWISKGTRGTEAKKLLSLMRLGIRHGDTVTVTVEGGDEAAVIAELKSFFISNL